MNTTILIATHNKGKARELIAEFQQVLPYKFISLEDLGVTKDCPETADTFEGNALQKANFYHRLTGYPTIADDSGLEVEALDNAPGVYSARWTGEHADDATNNAKLVEEMQKKGVHASKARYVCAMAYMDVFCEFAIVGTLDGIVKDTPSGTNGFSYDPYFYVDGKSIGDMTLAEKNAISHRAKAIKELTNSLLWGEIKYEDDKSY